MPVKKPFTICAPFRQRRNNDSNKPPTQEQQEPSPATKPPNQLATPAPPPPTTFFTLPAELRNQIYTYTASATRLHLFAPPSTSSPKSTSSSSHSIIIPPLLLTTHRTRLEFRPFLLSLAPLRATVRSFDFQPLERVVGSLYASELKALRQNRGLRLCLHFAPASAQLGLPPRLTHSLSPKRREREARDALQRLRRWCAGRADSLDRLPWAYVVVGEEGVENAGLERLGRGVWGLAARCEAEAERWEVVRVAEAIEREVVVRGGRKGE